MVSLPEKFLVLLTVLLPTANIVAQVNEKGYAVLDVLEISPFVVKSFTLCVLY